MAVELNEKGFQYARSLIEKDQYKVTEAWSPPTVDQENQYIESNGMEKFALWHLGVDTDANEETKGAWKFIFTSDFETVDRKGLVAIRQRSAQQGYTDIFERAGELLSMIDEKEAEKEKSIKKRAKLVTLDFPASSIRHVSGNTVEFVISNETIDRYGEKILAKGCIYDNYLANPVVLFQHDWTKPIGRCLSLRIKDTSVEATVEFFPELVEDPHLKTIVNLTLEGVLRAASVGFIPLDVGYEKVDGRSVKVYKQWELVEFSVVTVPANPEALAKSLVEKEGRILSQRNLELLLNAVDKIESAVLAIRELIDRATPVEDKIQDARVDDKGEISEDTKNVPIVIDFQTFVQQIRRWK